MPLPLPLPAQAQDRDRAWACLLVAAVCVACVASVIATFAFAFACVALGGRARRRGPAGGARDDVFVGLLVVSDRAATSPAVQPPAAPQLPPKHLWHPPSVHDPKLDDLCVVCLEHLGDADVTRLARCSRCTCIVHDACLLDACRRPSHAQAPAPVWCPVCRA
jgi:hypothetical protein